MGTVKLKSSDEVFQLKISLLGSDPEIWRTIQISSAATLSRLHKAIQSAFDWEDKGCYTNSQGMAFSHAFFIKRV